MKDFRNGFLIVLGITLLAMLSLFFFTIHMSPIWEREFKIKGEKARTLIDGFSLTTPDPVGYWKNEQYQFVYQFPGRPIDQIMEAACYMTQVWVGLKEQKSVCYLSYNFYFKELNIYGIKAYGTLRSREKSFQFADFHFDLIPLADKLTAEQAQWLYWMAKEINEQNDHGHQQDMLRMAKWICDYKKIKLP